MMYYNDKELIDAIKLLGVNKFYIEYENISSIYDYYNLAFDSILYELYYSENYKDSYVSIELNKIIKSLNKLTNRIRCINSEMDTRILHLEKICQKSFKNDISYYNENYKKLDESFDETSFLKFYKHKLSETNHKIEMLDKAKSLRRKLLSLQVKIDKLARDYNRYVDDKKEPETIDDYIKDNTSLVHFVFTNNNGNDYKLSGIDGFLFNCQFHKEKTPSLRVLNKAQNVRCFGCGFSNDDFIEETSCASIGYLMKKEDISKEEAISLINEVYELNISNRRCSRKDLVQKYRESLLSDEYKKLLLSSLNRMMNMYPTLDVENHINYLQKQLDTIGRIKNKNYQMKYKE